MYNTASMLQPMQPVSMCTFASTHSIRYREHGQRTASQPPPPPTQAFWPTHVRRRTRRTFAHTCVNVSQMLARAGMQQPHTTTRTRARTKALSSAERRRQRQRTASSSSSLVVCTRLGQSGSVSTLRSSRAPVCVFASTRKRIRKRYTKKVTHARTHTHTVSCVWPA